MEDFLKCKEIEIIVRNLNEEPIVINFSNTTASYPYRGILRLFKEPYYVTSIIFDEALNKVYFIFDAFQSRKFYKNYDGKYHSVLGKPYIRLSFGSINNLESLQARLQESFLNLVNIAKIEDEAIFISNKALKNLIEFKKSAIFQYDHDNTSSNAFLIYSLFVSKYRQKSKFKNFEKISVSDYVKKAKSEKINLKKDKVPFIYSSFAYDSTNSTIVDYSNICNFRNVKYLKVSNSILKESTPEDSHFALSYLNTYYLHINVSKKFINDFFDNTIFFRFYLVIDYILNLNKINQKLVYSNNKIINTFVEDSDGTALDISSNILLLTNTLINHFSLSDKVSKSYKNPYYKKHNLHLKNSTMLFPLSDTENLNIHKTWQECNSSYKDFFTFLIKFSKFSRIPEYLMAKKIHDKIQKIEINIISETEVLSEIFQKFSKNEKAISIIEEAIASFPEKITKGTREYQNLQFEKRCLREKLQIQETFKKNQIKALEFLKKADSTTEALLKKKQRILNIAKLKFKKFNLNPELEFNKLLSQNFQIDRINYFYKGLSKYQDIEHAGSPLDISEDFFENFDFSKDFEIESVIFSNSKPLKISAIDSDRKVIASFFGGPYSISSDMQSIIISLNQKAKLHLYSSIDSKIFPHTSSYRSPTDHLSACLGDSAQSLYNAFQSSDIFSIFSIVKNYITHSFNNDTWGATWVSFPKPKDLKEDLSQINQTQTVFKQAFACAFSAEGVAYFAIEKDNSIFVYKNDGISKSLLKEIKIESESPSLEFVLNQINLSKPTKTITIEEFKKHKTKQEKHVQK